MIDRRWEARLLEKDGNARATALVFHRDGEPVGDFRKASATACQAAGVTQVLRSDYSDAAFPYWRAPQGSTSGNRTFIVEGTWGAQIVDSTRSCGTSG